LQGQYKSDNKSSKANQGQASVTSLNTLAKEFAMIIRRPQAILKKPTAKTNKITKLAKPIPDTARSGFFNGNLIHETVFFHDLF
jgi:hypothetical protein